MISFRSAILLIILFGFLGCRQDPPQQVASLEDFNPAFLYATDEGELRILNIDRADVDEVEEVTTYTIREYTNLGVTTRNFGSVTTNYDGAYDWSAFREGERPRAVAVTHRENRIDPTHQTEYERQFVHIGRFASLRQMEFYSELNDRQQELREYNYWVKGRTVHFIDDRYYLALWTDYYDESSGVPRPNLPPGNNVTYLLLYDSEENRPTDPEIIASFFDGGYQSRNPPHNWLTSPGNTQVMSSATGKYYVTWNPVRLSTGFSPYFFRYDGTMAYNPMEAGGTQVYNRVPSQESFAIDLHPNDDELLVVSDNYSAYRSTMVLELGSSSDEAMSIVEELPFDQMELNDPGFGWGKVNANSPTWYVKFHPDGDHVAIIQAIENETPTVTIWNWRENPDEIATYEIGDPGEDLPEVTEIRKPAWDYYSEDQSKLYFMALHEGPDEEEATGNEGAYIHYLDINQNPNTESHTNVIRWHDDVTFHEMSEDPVPQEPQNLKGRRTH